MKTPRDPDDDTAVKPSRKEVAALRDLLEDAARSRDKIGTLQMLLVYAYRRGRGHGYTEGYERSKQPVLDLDGAMP